jgi:tRNA/tmRNA/rRNA uracil-C5-methylase (TrmA/RlmC/RlmD family)
VYVSCDPATLARDLSDITAEGFEITGARLYDLFPLTHRVEAVVTLARVARKTA